MVSPYINKIYVKILKEGWKPTYCRHVSNSVWALMLNSPDGTEGTTVWLIPSNYKPKELNSRVSEQIYRAYEKMSGDGY